MIAYLCVLLLFIFLCAEQERFIGNLYLDNENGIFFMPNMPLIRAHLLILSLLLLSDVLNAQPALQSWLALASGVMAIARLKSLHFLVLWRNSYIIAYYIALLLCSAIFIWLGWLLLQGRDTTTLIQIGLGSVCLYWAFITVLWWRCWYRH